jgi:hypothetical protein
MTKMKAQEMLTYALQHIYDRSQEVKSYQHTENGVTMTLYVDIARVGHLSFAAKFPLVHEKYDQLISNLNLPDCHYQTTETIKNFEVLRYRFAITPPTTVANLSKPVPSIVPLSTYQPQKKLYWTELKDDQCHICHRELTDPLSLKVKIGSICRKRVEELESKTSEMWESITRVELERIWTQYNIHQQKYDKKLAEQNQLAESRLLSDTGNLSLRPIPSIPPLNFVARPNPQPHIDDLPKPTCKFCGEIVEKYWLYDSKTGLCECWECSRKKNRHYQRDKR